MIDRLPTAKKCLKKKNPTTKVVRSFIRIITSRRRVDVFAVILIHLFAAPRKEGIEEEEEEEGYAI